MSTNKDRALNKYTDKESTRPSLGRIINYINTMEIREKDWDMLTQLLELDSNLYLFLMESLTLGEIDLYDLQQVFEYEWYEKHLKREIDSERERIEKIGPLINFKNTWNETGTEELNTKEVMDDVYYSFFYNVGDVHIGSQKGILPPITDSMVSDSIGGGNVPRTISRAPITEVLNNKSRSLWEQIKNVSLSNLLSGVDTRNLLLEEQLEELTEEDLKFMSSNGMTENQMRKMKTLAKRTILEGK